ncbi:hypothetical protein WA026_010311 [Henosepilachna vigintioctopunctata]
MPPYPPLCLLLLTAVTSITSQESAQYLQSAMRDLRELKDTSESQNVVYSLSTLADIFSTVSPQVHMHRRIHQNEIPELSLTKGELATLYKNAVSKGHTVQLDTGDDTLVNAAVHEIGSSGDHHSSDDHDSEHNDETGYYYYYYPIKTFFNEITSKYSDEQYNHAHNSVHHGISHAKPKPNYNYHKHTHQHNVKISSTKASTNGDKKNKLEPLFMAISGFLGMALMFVLSVLVLPKFGIKRNKPKSKHDLGEIARIALQAIEGKDCRERFACELSKTARSFNLHENRFVRLFWRVAPSSLSKTFSRVNKYANKQMKCTAIPCKKREPTPKPNHKTNRKKTKKI